jgi:hypothetical protein
VQKVDFKCERYGWLRRWRWTIVRDGRQAPWNGAWTKRAMLRDAVGVTTVLLNTTQAQQILDADG